jgi:hypothetical protein
MFPPLLPILLAMDIAKADPIMIIEEEPLTSQPYFIWFEMATRLFLSLKKDDRIPPHYSAAHNPNNIVQAEYEYPFYIGLYLVYLKEYITRSLIEILLIPCSDSRLLMKVVCFL